MDDGMELGLPEQSLNPFPSERTPHSATVSSVLPTILPSSLPDSAPPKQLWSSDRSRHGPARRQVSEASLCCHTPAGQALGDRCPHLQSGDNATCFQCCWGFNDTIGVKATRILTRSISRAYDQPGQMYVCTYG